MLEGEISFLLCFSVVKLEESVGVWVFVVINGCVDKISYLFIVSYEENGV